MYKCELLALCILRYLAMRGVDITRIINFGDSLLLFVVGITTGGAPVSSKGIDFDSEELSSRRIHP